MFCLYLNYLRDILQNMTLAFEMTNDMHSIIPSPYVS